MLDTYYSFLTSKEEFYYYFEGTSIARKGFNKHARRFAVLSINFKDFNGDTKFKDEWLREFCKSMRKSIQ